MMMVKNNIHGFKIGEKIFNHLWSKLKSAEQAMENR